MNTSLRFLLFLASLTVVLVVVQASQDKSIAEMKFNDVKEIAPGVFFRYSSISATDPKVPFGGSNHAWIVFKDYVVVIDANFPKEAGDVIADIKKTTSKPIRYVLDTHHHGDHAYGNAVWAKEGAKIVGHVNCSRLMQTSGPKQWDDAAKARPDVAGSSLKQVDTSFDDKMVLEDETQRVEFHFLGHAHTPGDAVAWLPKHRILCTGDACVNGAFNFMGHSHSASWVKVLEKMQAFDPVLVVPGHGAVSGKEVIEKQKRYFVELRQHVRTGIDKLQMLDEITRTVDLSWYKDWTGKAAKENKDNISHVYDEMQGKIDHSKLGYDRNPHFTPSSADTGVRLTQR
jgi:cyclase